jgi:primosomal protein N' (replication factor Y)
MGTQRLEEVLQQTLPEARILRLDSDVMSRKYAYREIFDAFSRHEADILVGTQMVAKGLDIPNVTLVGVVGADTAFSLPDYKAAERGFQLLTQVAGRAGRGAHPGQVIVQSLQPDHPVILRAKAQDYAGFYADELTRRQTFHFPPFRQVFRMIASGLEENGVRQFMKGVTLSLQQNLSASGMTVGMGQDMEVLGPASCMISRIQGRYRYQVMIKNRRGETGHRLITDYYAAVKPPDTIQFLLDVDAQSFL